MKSKTRLNIRLAAWFKKPESVLNDISNGFYLYKKTQTPNGFYSKV